jgi:type I restriction enzyme, S subunit
MNRATKWAEVRLGDIGQVFTGRTPSTKHPEYFGDEFFFITPGDMHREKHVHVTGRGLSDAGANLLRRIQLPPKSVCVSCIGWQMGEVVMTSATSFTNQQINSIVPNGDVDADFLYYSFVPRKQELLSLASAIGVRTPILNKSGFCDLRVMLPPFPTQRKIAMILSAYDDLIENNLQRIKILEEMAKNLYGNWFIKFRFPGHQHARFTDSPLGRIPEGWEAKSLGQLVDLIRDGVNPNSVDPETPYFGLEHLPKRSITLSDWGTASEVQSTKLLFKKGDILFGKIRPYFHKVGVAPLSGICSSDTMVIRPRSVDWFGLVLGCTSSAEFVEHATATSQGTKMPRANWDILAKYEIPVPFRPILDQFNEFMSEIVSQLHNFVFRNRTLRHTRDLLLPKLISGEVDVSELEITVPDEVNA